MTTGIKLKGWEIRALERSLKIKATCCRWTFCPFVSQENCPKCGDGKIKIEVKNQKQRRCQEICGKLFPKALEDGRNPCPYRCFKPIYSRLAVTRKVKALLREQKND